MKKIFYTLIAFAALFSFAGCSDDNKDNGGKEEEKKIDLAVPEGLCLASYGDESIKMEWEPVANAEFYTYKIIAKVIRDEVAVDSVVAMGKTVNTYKTIEALDPDCEPNGYNYWFSVAAGAGKLSSSEYSSYVRCEPGGLTPLVPENLRITATSEFGFTYEWDESECSDFYHYELTNAKGELIQEGDVNGTSKVFDGLKKGRYYYVSVQGVNAVKASKFSKKVEGLTFGTYIPALTFNASFATDGFSFREGDELYITDGTKWAGYVVKSSGKSTTLELTTEEEVEYDKVYTAYMPESLHELGVINGSYTQLADGTFCGVPAWAKSTAAGDVNLKFNSYMALVSLEVSSARATDVASIKLSADKPLSGYVQSVNEADLALSTGGGASDGCITLDLPSVVKISSTPQTFTIPVLAGSYGSISAIFYDSDSKPVAGQLLSAKSIKPGDVVKEKSDLKIVSEVEWAGREGASLMMSAYATIQTGTLADFDFGFLAIPYGESNWVNAEYIPGTIISSSSNRAVFNASIEGHGNRYIRPCAKPKGTPVSVASTGSVAFPVLMDFRETSQVKISACPEEQALSGTKFGVEFPTVAVKIKSGVAEGQTTYLFDGVPIIYSTGSQSGDRNYAYMWDKNDWTMKSYKLRGIINKAVLPGYKPVYVYWLATAAKKYFIGTASSASKATVIPSSNVTVVESEITTIAANSTVYFGSDSNAESTSYILLWYVK